MVTNVTYNKLCIIIIKVKKCQDFFIKTKTKTTSRPLGVLKTQSLETTSLGSSTHLGAMECLDLPGTFYKD